MNYLGMDYGSVRIGLSVGNDEARLARPLATIKNDSSLATQLKQIIKTQDIHAIVVGLPRGLAGQNTAQTLSVRAQVTQILNQADISLPLYWQDESLTSELAEKELSARRASYKKSDIDKLAASLILQDFLDQL